jgi:hypothetical protein
MMTATGSGSEAPLRAQYTQQNLPSAERPGSVLKLPGPRPTPNADLEGD